MGERKTKKYPGVTPLGGGKWRINVRIRIAGKIQQKRETFCGTGEQARTRFEQIKSEMRGQPAGSLTFTQAITFGDILNVYRDKRFGALLKPDVSRIDRLDHDLGPVLIDDFPQAFDKYIKLLRLTPTVKTGKPPTNGTINKITEIVKAAFNIALELDLIKENPVTSRRFPKLTVKPRDRYLSEDERLRLFNSIRVNAPHIEPIVRYFLAVPCRKSELIRSPREAYNAITNTIYIPDSKAGIPIYKPVPEEMKDYFRSIPSDCPYLFYRRDSKGRYYPIGDFVKSWKTCLKNAGITNCRIHDLRHCAASDLTISGNSERVIMDIAGWKTPMLSTYWHKNSLRSAMLVKFANCEHAVKTFSVENKQKCFN